MAVRGKEVLIKESSVKDILTEVVPAVINWLNSSETNSTIGEQFFATVFDARTKSLYRVFSDSLMTKYDFTTDTYELNAVGEEAPTVLGQQVYLIN